MINQINNSHNPVKPVSYGKDAVKEQNKQEKESVQKSKTDVVQFTQKNEESVTYANFNVSKGLDSSEIASLKSMADQANENLKRIVEQLILKQGKNFDILKISGFSSSEKVSAKDIEEARLAISEDGEFGVKAVSDRLFEFAKAVSGGDKAKFEELKGAIEKGFDAARKAFGGNLPEICNETYTETMRKLEAWVTEE